jgi:hypothetical protein
MQGLCLGLLVAVALAAGQPCFAGECAGKLERVDITSVTLLTPDNQKVILSVDPSDRQRAAQYLGKSVTVQYRTEKGSSKALLFQGCKAQR